MLNHAFKAALSFLNVAHYAAQYAHVRIRINKYLYIKQVAYAFVAQKEYAFKQYHGRAFYKQGLVGTVMHRVIIYGAKHVLSALELCNVLQKKLRIECIGAVVVYFCAFVIGKVVVRLIVIIVIYYGYVLAEAFAQKAGYGRFARSGAARNANGHNVVHVLSLRAENAAFDILYHILRHIKRTAL